MSVKMLVILYQVYISSRFTMKEKYPSLASFLPLLLLVQIAWCSDSDFTSSAFGESANVAPAAFGDFNSDELTDLFVISEDKRTVKILLASTKEPYFGDKLKLQCSLPVDYMVTSVVPGDFDGDALLDFLVTSVNLKNNSNITYVFINWGNLNKVNCSKEPIIQMIDEPLLIDYDQNLIADLFGRKDDSVNMFWIFSPNRSEPIREIPLTMPSSQNFALRPQHSHAVLDLNNDNSPDLVLTGLQGFGIWLYNNTRRDFVFNQTVPYPNNYGSDKIGQNLFIDVETADSLHLVVPVCGGDDDCSASAIYVYTKDRWFNLNVSFKDSSNDTWSFIKKGSGGAYLDVITLRSGDFNNDGYIDLLATLRRTTDHNVRQTFLLENVPCFGEVCNVRRTFQVQWKTFDQWKEGAVMGMFYDFMHDGILDVIFVHTNNDHKFLMSAFKNSLDYDANFIKVMVISNLKNKESEANSAAAATILTPKPTFGSSLPGAKIQYKTTTQDGNMQTGVAVQLPQSAHMAMHLPYNIFGLGRTPNFIEDLTIGVFNQTKTWNQIIPNSQLVVITGPTSNWRAQLFVTPSKIVLQTVIALTGTCVIIALIIGLLHWKERREDRIEKLQEAHRFHFDAM